VPILYLLLKGDKNVEPTLADAHAS